MTCRLLLPLVLGFAGLASSVQGAAYSGNFDALNPTLDLPGQDGWAINDPTLHLSTIEILTSSQAAALGGLYDAPTLTNVELTHAYGLSLSGSSFDVDMAIFPSTAGTLGRDTFGFSFDGPGAAPLMSVIFRPNVAVPNQLEVLWQGPAGAPVSTGFDIVDTGLYHLSIDFGSSGADGTFNAVLTGQVGAPLLWNNTLPAVGGATIDTFGANFITAVPANAGDNVLLFDNVVMVPEPSSALLIGLGLLAAARRRRTV